MADESPIQNDNYTAKSVILVSRNQNEPLPVQLEDGKAIVGDSTANSGIAQVAVPVPDGDNTHFLNGDGEWAAPAGGGVSQLGWRTTFSLAVDLDESTTTVIRPDLSTLTLDGVTTGINEGVVPSWISVDPTYPTTLLFDQGTYMIGINNTFVKQDSFQGATSVDGLTGYGLVTLTRRSNGLTSFNQGVLTQDPATWGSAAVASSFSVYIVSFPSDIERRRLGLQYSVNVTDPSFFCQATAAVDITRIG